MKNILWLSRHNILPCQLSEIKRIFGYRGFTIHQYKKKIPSAEWIIANIIIPKKIDIVIPVLPLTIISELVNRSKEYGYEVWWSDMETVKIVEKKPGVDDYDIFCEAVIPINGKFKIVRFKKFYRLKGISLQLEEISSDGKSELV